MLGLLINFKDGVMLFVLWWFAAQPSLRWLGIAGSFALRFYSGTGGGRTLKGTWKCLHLGVSLLIHRSACNLEKRASP